VNSSLLRGVLLSALILSTGARTWAQVGRGSIEGTVTDAQGAAVPGARITIVNTNTNAEFKTTASEQGFYSAPALAVGNYQVSAEADGFKRGVRSGLNLQVDQHEQVDFRLEVGAIVESVEVMGLAPLVDTASATVGKVIENRRIEDLPLNGRNALALTMLTPSVAHSSLNSALTAV
jgi:Carboxypeptidase regulatory-like domain